MSLKFWINTDLDLPYLHVTSASTLDLVLISTSEVKYQRSIIFSSAFMVINQIEYYGAIFLNGAMKGQLYCVYAP